MMKRSLCLIIPFIVLAMVLSSCLPLNTVATTSPEGEDGGGKATRPAAEPEVEEVSIKKDITYASPQVDGIPQRLKLDMFMPEGNADKYPALVYIHGGLWMEGGRSSCPGKALAKGGYVVACIDYRLVGKEGECSKDTIFPAAVQDVKSAVRWLRENARTYQIDADNIGLIGDSAGGHLAVLAGVSNGAKLFANTQNSGPSDAVQAVVDWYGPVDVSGMEIAFTEDACKVKSSDLAETYRGNPAYELTYAWSRFLGGALDNKTIRERAGKASPLAYLDGGDPPVLIIHGADDNVVPAEQHKDLHEALKAKGIRTTLITLPGVGHSYGSSSNPNANFLVSSLNFLDSHLK
jgi:acetyl esterase/lipase